MECALTTLTSPSRQFNHDGDDTTMRTNGRDVREATFSLTEVVGAMGVTLPHKGMSERITSAEAERNVPSKRECRDILLEILKDSGGLSVCCSPFDDLE